MSRVRVVRYPTDDRLLARVRAAPEIQSRPYVLYVGRLAPHKRADVLADGFVRSTFAASGGRLILVGADPLERDAFLKRHRHPAIEVIVRCSDAELASLYRNAKLLAAPSSEEGFGFPVWEARSCGIPVCVGSAGAVAEAAGCTIPKFAMASPEDVALAIDAVAQEPETFIDVPQHRSPREFAAEFVRMTMELTR
jgi:glycosyltransferase involved in cell wall biosynthesis